MQSVSTSEAFDSAAENYDEEFSETWTGQMQRKRVHQYLEKILENISAANQKPVLRILELNCGTGIDAVWLAKKGHKVLATDISEGMCQAVIKRVEEKIVIEQVEVRRMALADLENIKEKFDLIFSNFGGLNCIPPDELSHFLNTIPQKLDPHGRAVLVLMPRFCLWETFYYSLRLNFKAAFRRMKRSPSSANVGETKVNTWYYSPSSVKSSNLRRVKVRPVGLAFPPSYLSPGPNRKGVFISFFSNTLVQFMLALLEKIGVKLPLLANLSDHFLIELRQK